MRLSLVVGRKRPPACRLVVVLWLVKTLLRVLQIAAGYNKATHPTDIRLHFTRSHSTHIIMTDVDKTPKCERMKSRNESFDDSVEDNDNDNQQRRLGSQSQRSSSSDYDDDDDDAFVTNEMSEEDCLHFFNSSYGSSRALANESYDNNDSQQSPLQPQEGNDNNNPRKYEKSDSQEYQQAVAYSGALVGENILDSPSSQQRATVKAGGGARAQSPALPCLRDGRRSRQARNAATSPNNDDADGGLSAGLVAQGLAWVKNQRESRRRRYLQYQAEEQLRKIREAQNAERQGAPSTTTNSNKGLLSNPIFQNLANGAVGGGTTGDAAADTHNSNSNSNFNANDGGLGGRPASSSDADENDGDGSLGAQATVSQSGAGYSVELAVPFHDDDDDDEEEDATWIPPVRLEEEETTEEGLASCLLNAEQRQQVAQHVLPSGIAYAKWKRVYSLARDGDSFDTCLRLVREYNQTLVIIRTSKNELFGGFAEAAWEQPQLAGAQFYGGPTSCLFKVLDASKPKIKAYRWTGANRYIQLTDNHRKLLAFGGGGEEGLFGLCVESDFQRGSTGHCDTFGNEPLCSEENFRIVDVEIFGFLLGQF